VHPTLFHLGHLTLPTFGLLAAVGLIFALGLSQYTAPLAGADPDKLWDAGLFAVLTAFLLSRLLLVATHLQTFLRFPILLLTVPSLTATGLLLTLLATALWLRLKRIPIPQALDAWAPCATLAWAFLALGHFAEASDPGLSTTSLFSITMRGESTPQHPVALYAALTAVLLTAALFLTLRRPHVPGRIASAALIVTGLAQFLLSFLRQPDPASALPLDALQLVALAMLLAGLLALLPAHSSSQSHTIEPAPQPEL
jgi:phosphatidylglycerol:prolipoprotein diacylglycerol transferase